MSTRVIEGNAPHMIAVEDGEHNIAFGAHVGDDSKVDVIVNDHFWFEIEREEWWEIVAHLSSQGFHSPTMAQRCAMLPGHYLEPEGRSGFIVDSATRHTRRSRALVWVARKLHQPVYASVELVDGTTVYERI